MAQTEEEKAAAKAKQDEAKAAKQAEADKRAKAAEETAAADAERIAKEDEAKAEQAKADRAEKAELALQAQEAAEAAGETTPPPAATAQAPQPDVEINVLPMHDIVEKNDDVYIYENVQLPKTYANEKGVKKFTGDNGQVIYYTQVLVKKFSDNVVTDGASEEALDDE